jgi:hypothetical protein
MRKYRTKVSIFGGLLIALMLYASMTVSAVTTHFIENHGYTTVYSNSTLEASIDPWTFGNLEIDDLDNVNITFKGHYNDQRSPGQLYPANHYYNITAYYDDGFTRVYEYADAQINTYGNLGGTLEPSVQFDNVYEGNYINITLFARVTLQGRSAQDSDVHSIHLI